MAKILSFPGDRRGTPEQRGLGSIEAPIIRAALNEVDYSVHETYAKVVRLPIRAGAEAVAAAVDTAAQEQPVSPAVAGIQNRQPAADQLDRPDPALLAARQAVESQYREAA